MQNSTFLIRFWVILVYVQPGEFDSFEYPANITNVELKTDNGHDNEAAEKELVDAENDDKKL